MRKIKSALALLLAFAMVATLTPTSASAKRNRRSTEETTAAAETTVQESTTKDAVDGTVGTTATNNGPTVSLMAEGGTRDANSVSINAGKTVTDTDGDGIYELALNIKATSESSSSAKATKNNVVMVIDVSGSMDYDVFTSYTYSADTYSSDKRYYSSNSVNNDHKANGTQLYHDDQGWYYNNYWGRRQSYTGTVYEVETRLDATKRAANAVVDALLDYNTNADGITDMFEISIVKFAQRTVSSGSSYNGTVEIVSHSTDGDSIKAKINELYAGGGTHWRAALEQALTSANWYKDNQDSDENTSVIFLTDGFPTERGTGNDGGSESDDNVSRGYLDARNPARNIVKAGFALYNIFAYGSDTDTKGNTRGDYNTGKHTGFEFLCGLANYAYGSGSTDNFSTTTATAKNYCFNAKSTEALVAAFSTIIDHITNNVGFAGVNLTDGVSLGATSTSVALNGTANADSMRYTVKDANGKLAYIVKISGTTATFTIYNSDGTTSTVIDNAPETVTTTIKGTTITSQVYSVTANDTVYKISPATIDADTGMVKWDLAGLGILESGYTYTVAFDVWPNQLSYDIAADLNNGIFTDIDAALDAYKITDETERKHIKDAIVKNDDGSYSLYTNYSQEIEYYPAESQTDDDGNVTWTYGDKQTQPLDRPDPIKLQGSLLPLEKQWEAGLSISELNELLWKEGIVDGTSKEYKITLHVWKADTVDELETMINAGDTSKAYISKDLGWDSEKKEYIWSKSAAVAPGMMVNVAEAEALGFDVTDPSKLRTFTNDQGETLTYYVVESGHYYYVTEDGADLHFELDTVLYHPMIVDGTLYNVFFGEGQTVEKMDPLYSVTATNTLKGGLNILKVVSTTKIKVENDEITEVTEPVDDDGIKTVTDEFTYEIKIWKEDENGDKSAVYTYDDQIKNGELISGSIGYRVFSKPSLADDGTIKYGSSLRGAILTKDSQYTSLAGGIFATIANNETTLVLTMPANGEIRLVNLPAGTKYTVREIPDDSGSYTYAATKSQIKTTEVSEGTVSTANTVSGTISGNKANIETYYNWASSFYVYHSSDNTIEKISFADERVSGTYDTEDGYTYTFNIVDETKNPYLYGGYYKAYSKASMDDAAIKDATYTKDSKGKSWVTDTAGTAYDATKANIWKKANAYTSDVEITGGGIGTAMTPKANIVYYLKEVPNGYIRPYIHFTYDDRADGKPLKKLYVITAADDTNYGFVGYVLAPATTGTAATTRSLTISVKKPDGTLDANLTAKNIFDGKTYHGSSVTVTRGYLYWSDLSFNIGTEFTFQPCWNTLDGVLVKGLTVRTVNNGTSATTINVNDVAAE